MFDSRTSNLLPKNAEPFDQELWRVVDEDKMLDEVNRFPSFEAFQEHLENYWKKAVKGDVMEQKLLRQKTQEWEVLQAKWERDYIPAKKRLDEWESKVEAIEAKDKQRHTKAFSAWERQVEANKVKDAERYDKLLQQWEADLQVWKEKTLDWPKGKPKPPKPLKPKAPPATPKAAKPQFVSSPRPPKPAMPKEPGAKPASVSPEELQTYINEEARKTAYGMVDRDASNLDSSPSGEKGALPFMRERFPADTSTIVETPWGEGWSFDTHLRSYDLDRIVLKNTNRFSGEVAIRNAYETPEELERVTRAYKSELDHAVQNRAITEAQHAKELKVWEDGLNRIKGVRNQGDVKGLKDALSRLLRTEAYNTSGSMMVTSQYGEVGGAIAYTGMKALFHLVPGLADYMRNLRHGQGFAEAVRAAEKRAFGESMSPYIWQNRSNLVSRAFKEATTAGSKIQKLDAIGTAANFMSRIVSSLPPVSLAKLTDTMVSGARYDTIADSIEWAFGREKFGIALPGWTPKNGFHLVQSRNPFSEPKLKAAGVSKDFTGKLKQDIQTYTEHKLNGTIKSLRVDLWERERPNTYHKWKMLIDNQAMRAIQQPTIGNQNVLKDQNWFTRIMFQFKDFTFKAVNGQAMRALTHHEIEDATNALLSLASNGMVYAGLTVGRAWAYFPNDDQKREEYLESRLTLGNLAWAGIMRGAILGSAPSLAMDVYEASTGRQSFRTTTDRTSRFTGRGQQDRDFSDMVGDALTQFPAVKAATAPYDILHTAYKAADPDEQVTKRDLRTLMQTLPLQNWLPMVYLVSQMIDETDLPEKDVFKR